MNRIATLTMMATIACFNGSVRADVKLPAIFGDHMVLQRGTGIPVWGTADPGERVTVTAGGHERSTHANAQGKWRVTLDPMNAGDPIEMRVTGKNTVTFKDVLIGEVWVCSGQSNMGFPLKNAANGRREVQSADHPTIRLFTVGRSYPDQPQEDLTGQWEICSPATAEEFSAVAYFFARGLQQNLKQPIGLIEPSWGGTRAEAWMPRATFDGLHLPYEPAWTEQWLHPIANPASTQPVKERPYQAPAALYNGMIAPIAGYAMRGVVWYQGETNTAYGEHYGDVLRALITSWRAAWGQGDVPFLVVQLPNFRTSRFWPTLRAAQARVARELPNVGLVVTIDVGNPRDAHPRDKQTVGARLALAARKIAYGQDVPHSGPTFKSMEVIGAEAVIRFDHVYEGLKAKDGALQGFEVAGEDGQFVPAEATIDDDRVRVRADGIASPRIIRYGWANDPACTLYNSADLPAVPFDARR